MTPEEWAEKRAFYTDSGLPGSRVILGLLDDIDALDAQRADARGHAAAAQARVYTLESVLRLIIKDDPDWLEVDEVRAAYEAIQ